MPPSTNCVSEVYITRKANHSDAFAHDLHVERVAVSEGKSWIRARNELQRNEIRPFTKNINEEIKACLGNIAAGNCPIYQKVIN